MRLTNTIRDAFVRAAMQDVPEVDYDTEIRKAATAAAIKALPPSVRKVYDDEKTRPYLETRYLRYGGVSVNVPGRALYGAPDLPRISEADDKALNELANKKALQERSRNELSEKLRACAYAVTTRAALVELLPEFEKYLPADEAAANRTLPVIANIVSDFTKAGWPKGKKAEPKKKVALPA